MIVVTVGEAAVLGSLAVAIGKMSWDNVKALGNVKDRISSLEAGMAILLDDAGHDPSSILDVENPVQTDGGTQDDETD